MPRPNDKHEIADDPPVYMREDELAARWRISVRTLQRWRREGRGPPFVRFGKRVAYGHLEVLSYEQRARQDGGAR
jgi:predicted site-specific integrase-resolvase